MRLHVVCGHGDSRLGLRDRIIVRQTRLNGSALPNRASMTLPRRDGATACDGGIPRPNRVAASLGSFCSCVVRRIEMKSKIALSINTLVVASDTSVSLPPMMPAMATGPCASVTKMSSLENSRICPSSVCIFSPGCAARMRNERFAAARPCDQFIVIERVQRLAIAEHDIVGNVDDVVDGTHPGAQQTLLHPQRGGRDFDTADQQCAKSAGTISGR